MVKGNPKSSASSATRKKHARRAIAQNQADEPKPPTKEKLPKGKKKEPRQKIYIPPFKPSPPQPDPLDTTGLALTLPAELLIILRSLGKKAEITKLRALEELQFSWLDRCRDGADEFLIHTLSKILPVWFHHIPSLFLHSSRRIRLMAATLHASLLHIPHIREQLVLFIHETATTSQMENILGTWCMIAHDVDRMISTIALQSWNDALAAPLHSMHLGTELLSTITGFVENAALDPLDVYISLNPPSPAVHLPIVSKKPSANRPTPVTRKEIQEPRHRVDETEESEQEKMARIRCGAMGAIRWLLGNYCESPSFVKEIIPLLSNPALWSALYPEEECPFLTVSSFGYAQPAVRKYAWLLLQDTLKLPKETVHSLLPILSRAVLLSAWNERDPNVHTVMWQPLLTFLRDYPSCWDLGISKSPDGENNTESEDESKHEPEGGLELLPADAVYSSAVYRDFLAFLESGCGGSPLQGYPAVIVIMSTIPITLLLVPEPPFSTLFTSMWTAVDIHSSVLLQRSTFSAFLSSLVECVTFFVKRLHSEQNTASAASSVENSEMVAKTIIQEQTKRVWDSLRDGRLVVDAKVSTALLSNFLRSLYNIQECHFAAAWDIISRGVKDWRNSDSLLVVTLLNTLQDQFLNKDGLESRLISLTKDTVRESVENIRNDIANAESRSQTSQGLSFLVDILDTFREELSSDPEIIEARTVVDNLVNGYCLRLLGYQAPLIQTYLTVRNSKEHCLRLWHALLAAILGDPQKSLLLLGPILDTALTNGLPSYLRPNAGELDTLILQWTNGVVAGSSTSVDLPLLQKVLRAADYVLSNQGFASVCYALFGTFNHQIHLTLWRDSTFNFDTLLRLLEVVLEIFPFDLYSEEFDSTLSNIFILGYLLPACSSDQDSGISIYARGIWKQYLQHRRQDYVISKLKHHLSDLIRTTKIKLKPEHIVSVALEHASDLRMDVVDHLLPSAEEFDIMLKGLSQIAIHPSLAVIDPLIASVEELGSESPNFDVWGYSSYARVVSAMIWLFSENRRVAKHYIWALTHILSFTVYASDIKSYPAGHSSVFSSEVKSTDLDRLVTKAAHITTYLLNPSSEDAWRIKCLDAVMNTNGLDESKDMMSSFLANLIIRANENDTSHFARILKITLQHSLRHIGRDEADRWFGLARRLEYEAPQTSMAIISTIIECAPEPQRLDRYRNELAASLLDIPARQANRKGLITLRKLAMTAPSPEAEIIFLPQHRAVNVVKACQQWASSDEDIDEEVESAMMLVFLSLVPILQTVSGAHWEFIFDIIESNLENSTVGDDMTIVSLARAMKLVVGIQDLAKTNKLLSDSWKTRRTQILTLVRNMLMVQLDATGLSAPHAVCRELMLVIAQDLPADLVDASCLEKMCHLLKDPSISVQKSAYHLLSIAARKRTEHLVIEASVDAESNSKVGLPEELIAILQFQFEPDDSRSLWQEPTAIRYLLGWMLVFDSFQDASLKVKSYYIDQLRNLNLITREFMPGILSLLQLNQGLARTFKLDVWSVDEYYVELFDPDFSMSTPLLTAHLYYRALLSIPSLIHSWVLDCKDRQISSTVTTYTATHFSPVLIRAELAQVRSVAGTSQLVDENFKIKVIQSTSEVISGYAVDEHELEIKLKIPADWPLHKIEVKDVKRVGVEEHRWRAWILAVQQSIWSHNGKVVDSLALFKKNVMLHFEGQTECAICYSIINPMDGSLPRKPCKTCRNRFHAGCLYKWFNTSHSSSCPLCRSDII